MLEQILSLPVKKKIGQLFFIGLTGTEVDQTTKSFLSDISPGGICFFARNLKNPEQVRGFLEDITHNLQIAPLLSIDQEGGTVDRLRRILTPMPAANSVLTAEDAVNLAEITAEVLRILGFNMNFAPVVDVVNEQRRKFSNGLYSRAFGNSTEEIFKFAGAYLEALQSNGCLGCIKHFPGLGASEVDSHEELPMVNLTEKELFDNDLQPYRDFLKAAQTHAIMIAHAGFPLSGLQETDSDGKLLASSLSYNFVTKLLREELGFNGVAITDDLEMGAIIKNYGIGTACKNAIKAGVDMLSICADPDKIQKGFQSVLESFNNGEISEVRIDQSLRHIAHLKTLMQPALPFDAVRLTILSEKIAELKARLE